MSLLLCSTSKANDTQKRSFSKREVGSYFLSDVRVKGGQLPAGRVVQNLNEEYRIWKIMQERPVVVLRSINIFLKGVGTTYCTKIAEILQSVISFYYPDKFVALEFCLLSPMKVVIF